MTFDILQETEVGRVVNGLKRRSDLDVEVADLAKTIVKKWKDIVANHEEREEAELQAKARQEAEKAEAARQTEDVEEDEVPEEEPEQEEPEPPPPPTSKSD